VALLVYKILPFLIHLFPENLLLLQTRNGVLIAIGEEKLYYHKMNAITNIQAKKSTYILRHR
jgi:hypothetical protein